MIDSQDCVAALVVMMVVIAAFESAIPLRANSRSWRRRIKPNLVLMAMTFGLSFVLSAGTVFFLVGVEAFSLGSAFMGTLPEWVSIPVSIFILDFFA